MKLSNIFILVLLAANSFRFTISQYGSDLVSDGDYGGSSTDYGSETSYDAGSDPTTDYASETTPESDDAPSNPTPVSDDAASDPTPESDDSQKSTVNRNSKYKPIDPIKIVNKIFPTINKIINTKPIKKLISKPKTKAPTKKPTKRPTAYPSKQPTAYPTKKPTYNPTKKRVPTRKPTRRYLR
jgi:hypothetical protein